MNQQMVSQPRGLNLKPSELPRLLHLISIQWLCFPPSQSPPSDWAPSLLPSDSDPSDLQHAWLHEAMQREEIWL